MTRWRWGIASLALVGCVLTPIPLEGRRCPCIAGWVCDEELDLCTLAVSPADGGAPGDATCIGCGSIVPSNVDGVVALDDGTATLTVPAGEVWWLDPDDGKITARSSETGAVRVVRDAGTGTIAGIRYEQASSGATEVPAYGVFAIGALHVAEGGALSGVQGATRALVLVSAGDVVVDGLVSVGARADGPGPGGGAGGEDRRRDGHGAGGGRGGRDASFGTSDGGGGGGALGSAGGGGGGRDGGSGGQPHCDETLVPLCAGSGGGAGGDNDGGRGGHGGGALQITSATRIEVRGQLDASGEGGHGGYAAPGRSDTGAGGGGGSGGAILLEATEVVVTGQISALGGAGGQGATCNDCDGSGADGATFDPSGTPPAAGSDTQGEGGGGAAGSDSGGVAGDGGHAPNGGGGGGGAGRVRILTSQGDETFDAASLHPSIASGLTTVGEVSRRVVGPS